MTETTQTETVLDLDDLTDLASQATGRDWRWSDHRVPELIATFDVAADYESSRTVLEADHDGGCSCRKDCTLELSIEPHDRAFIAGTGPDLVLALVARIRDLEAQVSA